MLSSALSVNASACRRMRFNLIGVFRPKSKIAGYHYNDGFSLRTMHTVFQTPYLE